ncbi:MAG: response regulator [Candidatus Krumholzibacteriota bacterium]|nr:response regulator [Candidatus Krumholzibacteriota bacterium]
MEIRGTHEGREELSGKLAQKTATHRSIGETVLSILDNDVVGIIILDREGRHQVFNSGAERLTGYRSQELLGKMIPEALYDEGDRKVLREALAGNTVIRNREIRIRRHGGGDKDIIFNMSPQLDRRGKITGYLQVLLDNSEKKHLQELLRHSQKMETVGEMAGGIAHDFNNLLEGILGYTTFMMDLVEKDHEFRSYLEIIERSARKASDLTDRLLTLSRDRSLEEKLVNCNVLLREVVKLLERTVDKKIAMELNLEKDLRAIRGAAGQLEQGLLNVCLNSRDAMPDGGKLVISTENVVLDQSFPKLSWNMKSGDYVRISIADNGMGMDEETRTRIFEPFFTTKKRGEGTGLGLNMVYGIVDGHGGFINVYSEVGRGTVFNIYLPADAGLAPAEAAPPVKAEAPPGNNELILLIDDEELIRDLGVDMLEQLGYRPITARDAREGMKLFKERADEIDLVILDMIMPGANGKEVLQEIRAMNSDVLVLLSSGYNRASIGDQIIEGEKAEFIQKPYSMEDLAWEIHRLLSSREEG